jgi:hypothetical protein
LEVRCTLHPRRIVTTLVASGGFALACLSLLGGCADETKTTGTQLQLSEKDKDIMEGARAAMKGQRAARKQEQIEDRKAKK